MTDFTERLESVKTAEALEDYARARLQPMGKSFVCPGCGSGTGPSHSPAFTVKGNRWRCFSCGEGGDLLDLIGIVDGIPEGGTARLEAAESFLGIVSPTAGTGRPAQSQTALQRDSVAPQGQRQAAAPDYTEGREVERQRIRAARAAMRPGTPGYAYAQGRGFTDDEIARFGLGWSQGTDRLVIPYSADDMCHYHADRAISDTDKGKYHKPASSSVGTEPLFNAGALDRADLVCVVEGPIDALAIEACGGSAVALCGTGCEKLVSEVRGRDWHGTLALMLDDDEAGRKAQAQLAKRLEQMGIPHSEPGQVEGCKDAGEALEMGDRAGIIGLLDKARLTAEDTRLKAYNDLCGKMSLKNGYDLTDAIWSLEGVTEPVPTGITTLDKAIGGGLKPGLTVLGAISSLGKTSLLVQIADTVAAAGRPVLFVTVEESARALVAKSLTRAMSRESDGVSAGDLLDPRARATWDDGMLQAFDRAREAYRRAVAPWLMFMEPEQQPTVETIAKAAELMRSRSKVSPVVMVDYLQLLASPDVHDSDKRATDRNMTALRQLARDLDTPVVAVSSLNRGSYSDDLTMTAFKESGSIEYGADLLLVMQPAGFKQKLDSVMDNHALGGDRQGTDHLRKMTADQIIESTKRDETRRLEIKVLKFRGGRLPSGPAEVRFNARHCEYYGVGAWKGAGDLADGDNRAGELTIL